MICDSRGATLAIAGGARAVMFIGNGYLDSVSRNNSLSPLTA
jgi:hypothetical protein